MAATLNPISGIPLSLVSLPLSSLSCFYPEICWERINMFLALSHFLCSYDKSAELDSSNYFLSSHANLSKSFYTTQSASLEPRFPRISCSSVSVCGRSTSPSSQWIQNLSQVVLCAICAIEWSKTRTVNGHHTLI